jgi:hypothetical protein
MAANQPPGGYPPPGGGYPPPGGGYPPQQGGGYPPQQGGGYPPQQQGYPPQGAYPGQGGYPPQGYAQPGFEPQHSRPGTVTGAAILWIIYGSLGTLGGLMSLRAGATGVIGLGVAVSFLMAGIQALMGKGSVLAWGIFSIVWGAITLIAFLALGSLMRGFGGAGGILAVVGFIIGGMLITAGILGCMGNAKWKAWRMTKGTL